jgi:hypothetical protein
VDFPEILQETISLEYLKVDLPSKTLELEGSVTLGDKKLVLYKLQILIIREVCWEAFFHTLSFPNLVGLVFFLIQLK